MFRKLLTSTDHLGVVQGFLADFFALEVGLRQTLRDVTIEVAGPDIDVIVEVRGRHRCGGRRWAVICCGSGSWSWAKPTS
jgi:hypothetical protein